MYPYFDYPDFFPTLRDMMQLQIPLNESNKQKLKQIKDAENSVCIHIRMGDVLELTVYDAFLVKPSYIEKSILKISKEILKKDKTTKNITFFFFSNTMKLVKKRLPDKELQLLVKDTPVNINFDYVDINKDSEPYFELELMKNCNHFINSGGGFSKLASILGENESKIIITPGKDDFSLRRIVRDGLSEREIEWGYRLENRNIKIL
jgi:hypothetical protein